MKKLLILSKQVEKVQLWETVDTEAIEGLELEGMDARGVAREALKNGEVFECN